VFLAIAILIRLKKLAVKLKQMGLKDSLEVSKNAIFDILGNNEEEISLDMFTKVNTVSNISKQNYDINISKEKTDVSNENLSNITDNNYEIPKIVIRPKGSK